LCTVVILRRPGHPWPFLLAANRDELAERPALAPGRHWPDSPHVVAGLDLLGGGSWLGCNDDGVVCAVLNRRGSLGPLSGKRSRGELVLEALDHAEASIAAEALVALEPRSYRPFNLVIADVDSAWWLRGVGHGTVQRRALRAGLSFLEAGELDDWTLARTRRYLPRFRDATVPDPAGDDWRSWRSLLADRASDTGEPRGAMCVVTGGSYGTRSSALLALPADPAMPPVWLHAEGRPGEAAFEPIDLVAAPAGTSRPRPL
jgi:uncharacterized protein with NRDE domain